MAPVILQIHFPYQGPFGEAMVAAMKDLAQSIAHEPGFIWKVWTESEVSKEAGGVYLFSDRASAEAYLGMHAARLKGFGVPEVAAKIFEVNEALSEITLATLAPRRAS
ncbi:MAG: mono-oxygenase [Monoraphidium minutum]|nr:MAG: mono-oxygenase [Monoraphidium minutum]